MARHSIASCGQGNKGSVVTAEDLESALLCSLVVNVASLAPATPPLPFPLFPLPLLPPLIADVSKCAARATAILLLPQPCTGPLPLPHFGLGSLPLHPDLYPPPSPPAQYHGGAPSLLCLSFPPPSHTPFNLPYSHHSFDVLVALVIGQALLIFTVAFLPGTSM